MQIGRARARTRPGSDERWPANRRIRRGAAASLPDFPRRSAGMPSRLLSSAPMDRRTLLTRGGLALAGWGIGCATSSTSAPSRSGTQRPKSARPAINLAPVRVSWDRVLRTTVGLRPHRDSGFVLRAEKLDSKTLIHNYGHAGAGMSLAWGCGVLVAEFAQETGERRAAVLGCDNRPVPT